MKKAGLTFLTPSQMNQLLSGGKCVCLLDNSYCFVYHFILISVIVESISLLLQYLFRVTHNHVKFRYHNFFFQLAFRTAIVTITDIDIHPFYSRADLFGETVCMVGMHTKDKSKAASVGIVRQPRQVNLKYLCSKIRLLTHIVTVFFDTCRFF